MDLPRDADVQGHDEVLFAARWQDIEHDTTPLKEPQLHGTQDADHKRQEADSTGRDRAPDWTPMFEHVKPRQYRLIATRMNIYNNLLFRTDEYDDWKVITQLLMKGSFNVALHAKIVAHHVVELYAAAKKVAISNLNKARVQGSSSFTMVVDFWTSKVQAAKFLGIRVYFVDKEWNMRSILLGTRRFDPMYGDRARGISGPSSVGFSRWRRTLGSPIATSLAPWQTPAVA